MSSTVSAFLGCLFGSLVVYLWSPKYSPANETDIARLVKQLVEQQMTLQATNQTFNSTTHAGRSSSGQRDRYNSSLHYCQAQDEKLRKIEELETELKEKEERLRQDFEAKLKMLASQSKEQMETKIKEMEEKFQRELETLKEENEKLNDINKKLKEELTEEMKRKTAAIQQESKKELEFKVQNLTVEFNNTLRILNESWEAKLKTGTENSSNTLKTMQDTFLEKFIEVNYRQDLFYTVIDHMGFMKKETWGAGMLVLALLDVAVVVFACCRFFAAPRARGDNDDIFTRRVVQGNNNKTRPLPIKIAIDANTISVVCFRNDEEMRLVQLGEELIRDAQTKLPNLRVQSCVVNTKDDIRNIPSCKVALVFVYPDEREMILEDPIQHIGGTLRKDVVEVLMDSTVKTILVIYDDPNSTHDKLQDNLFNPRLSQIKVHELLKKLNEKKLLLSIKDSFSDHQKKHLEHKFRKFFNGPIS